MLRQIWARLAPQARVVAVAAATATTAGVGFKVVKQRHANQLAQRRVASKATAIESKLSSPKKKACKELHGTIKIGDHNVPFVIDKSDNSNSFPTKKEIEKAFVIPGEIESACPIVRGLKLNFGNDIDTKILSDLTNQINEECKNSEKEKPYYMRDEIESTYAEPTFREDNNYEVLASFFPHLSPANPQYSLMLYFSENEFLNLTAENNKVEKYIPEVVKKISHLIKSVSAEGLTGMKITFKKDVEERVVEKLQHKLEALSMCVFLNEEEEKGEKKLCLKVLTDINVLDLFVKREWKTLFGNSLYYSHFHTPFRASFGIRHLTITQEDVPDDIRHIPWLASCIHFFNDITEKNFNECGHEFRETVIAFRQSIIKNAAEHRSVILQANKPGLIPVEAFLKLQENVATLNQTKKELSDFINQHDVRISEIKKQFGR